MTTIKYFDSTQIGAPQLTGQVGSLIGLLDACLIDGFNLKSITSLSVTANVATATVAAGHGYALDRIVLIAGATPAGLNGEKRITWADTNTFKFDATGIADGAATGTITSKIAPAGWEKPFTGTNLAAYRSLAVDATRLFLRVDDTLAQYATWVGREDMTDINTATGWGSTVYAKKSNAASTATRPWALIASDRFFYFMPMWHSSYGHYGTCCFGDLISYKAGDTYHCVLIGDVVSGMNFPGADNGFALINGNATGASLARSHTQTGGPVALARRGHGVQASAIGVDGMVYPNPPDNALLLHHPILVVENGVRGHLPGLYQPLHNVPLGNLTVAQHQGKSLLALNIAYSNNAAQCLLDITGPWA